MKKTLSLVSSIIMMVFTVFLFMPIIFTMEYYKNESPGVGVAGLAWSEGVNIFELNILFILLILIFAIASIIVLLLNYAGKLNKNRNKLLFLPVGTFIVFISACISRFASREPNGEPCGTATWGKYGFYEYVPNWGFYIVIALILAVAVISLLLALGKIKDAEPATISNNPEHFSNADELLKYKNLLDSGIITQEEFDAKKKEILGL